jgi:hypothetical protein
MISSTLRVLNRALRWVLILVLIGTTALAWGAHLGHVDLRSVELTLAREANRLVNAPATAWWVVAAIGVLAVAIGLFLTVVELPRPRHLGVPDLVLRRRASGSTSIAAKAVAEAAERRLRRNDDILDVTVSMHAPKRPARTGHRSLTLDVLVEVEARAELPRIREKLRATADDVATTLHMPVQIGKVQYRFSGVHPSRVC